MKNLKQPNAHKFDESTDPIGKPQVVTFIRFICDNELIGYFYIENTFKRLQEDKTFLIWLAITSLLPIYHGSLL